MIECKPYKTSFLKPDTCIARQEKMKEILPKVLKKEKDNEAPFYADYQKIAKCRDCKQGLEFYKKHLEKEKVMGKMKRCTYKKCLKLLPATEEIFGLNKYAPDGLNYYCRECQKLIAKRNYSNKKVGNPPKTTVKPPKRKTPVKIEVKTRKCRDCKRTLFLTSEDFHKKGEGFAYRCKPCRNKAKQEYRAGRILQPPKNCFLLDLREEPEILEKLKAWADEDRRLPEQQIIYFLEHDLEVVIK